MSVIKEGEKQKFPTWSEISQHGIANFPAGGECKPHHHDANEFYVVVNGTLTAFIDENTYELGPGDLLPIKAGSKHGLKAKEDVTLVYFFGGIQSDITSSVAKHVDASGKSIEV